jgi:hypothetical protein
MEYVYLHDSDYDYDYDYDYDDYDYYTDDLSKSEFLLSIFQSLYSRSYVYVITGRGALENEVESIKAYANEYGITINSSSKSSVTFAFDNKTYELKAKDFELDKYDNALIDVTLSSGEKSCSFYSETGELEGDDFDRSACRSDLYEYYKTDDVEDYMGNRYVYGYEYRRNNSSEFESCVSEMIGLPTDSYGLYKKTAPKKSDEEIWSEYNHKMKMVQKLFK